mgnify:CR=1 FL=1
MPREAGILGPKISRRKTGGPRLTMGIFIRSRGPTRTTRAIRFRFYPFVRHSWRARAPIGKTAGLWTELLDRDIERSSIWEKNSIVNATCRGVRVSKARQKRYSRYLPRPCQWSIPDDPVRGIRCLRFLDLEISRFSQLGVKKRYCWSISDDAINVYWGNFGILKFRN